MNRRFATHPLNGARTLESSSGDRPLEGFPRKRPPPPRVKGVGLGNAKSATEVTAGKVEQERGNQFFLLAQLDPLLEDPGHRAGLAWPPLTASTGSHRNGAHKDGTHDSAAGPGSAGRRNPGGPELGR